MRSFKGATEASPSIKLNHNIHTADTFVSDADVVKGTAKVVLTNCLGFRVWRVVKRSAEFYLIEPEETSQGNVSKVTTEDQDTTSIEPQKKSS